MSGPGLTVAPLCAQSAPAKISSVNFLQLAGAHAGFLQDKSDAAHRLGSSFPCQNVPPCPDPGRESTLSAPDPLDARLRATFAKGSHALSDSA